VTRTAILSLILHRGEPRQTGTRANLCPFNIDELRRFLSVAKKNDAVVKKQSTKELNVNATDAIQDKIKSAFAVNKDDPLSTALFLYSQVIFTSDGSFKIDNDETPHFHIAIADMIEKMKSNDQVEALLSCQIIGTHNIAMTMLKRTVFAGSIDHMNAYGNLANKLLRTVTTQVETLNKYRRGNEQKMIVEHVHVNEGGQAIVGNVNQGEGGKCKKNRLQTS